MAAGVVFRLQADLSAVPRIQMQSANSKNTVGILASAQNRTAGGAAVNPSAQPPQTNHAWVAQQWAIYHASCSPKKRTSESVTET
jgi:hypothetical protein